MSKFSGKYFVTGKSLPHTMSPDIYLRLGLNYGVKEFPTGEDFLSWVNEKNYDGFNVTIPYKETVMPCLDYISDEAKEIGAVNTVVKKDGKLYGYNTDCYGMARAIKENGIELKDKVVAVLGSGGTSKCAVYVCKKEGAKEVKVVSRSGEYNYEKLYEDVSVEIIINTTPVGMFPNVSASPVDLKKLLSVKAVYDVIYNPLTTALVGVGKELGLKSGNGLSMLVYQGIKAFELYTDTKCGDEVAQRVLNEINSEKQNIVLVGMPGAGKSTYGKHIAKLTGREFFDTDEVFEERFNATPKEVILAHGEENFRSMESEVVASLSTKLGVVIATGGGAVLKEENRKLLKANGKVVFIDRKLECLATKGRPLSEEFGVKKLYETRFPIYEKMADLRVNSDASTVVKEKVLEILALLK